MSEVLGSSRGRFLFVLSFLLLGAIWMGTAWRSPLGERIALLELKRYDWLHRLLPRLPSSGRVVLIPIPRDRPTLQALRALPEWERLWGAPATGVPRAIHAALIDHLAADGARVIAFDVRFGEEGDPEGDRALAEAIRRARNVVLVEDVELRGDHFHLFRPPPALADAAMEVGAPFLAADPDGMVRGVTLFRYDPHHAEPVTAVSALIYQRLAPTGDRSDLRLDSARREVHVGGTRVPVDANGRMLIRFNAPPSAPLTYLDVLTGSVSPEKIRGKVVLVYAERDVHDQFRTPGGEAKPAKLAGGVVHALALETLLSGRFLAPHPWMERIWVSVIAVLLPWAFARYPLSRSLLFLGAAWGGMEVGTIVAYVTAGWWIPTLTATCWMIGFGGVVVLTDFFRAKGFFSQFAPPALVDRTLLWGDLPLDTRKRQATALVCDVRGFTAWTEREDSSVVMAQLQECMEDISSLVQRHEGRMIDYQGDAAVAVFLGLSPMRNHAWEAAQTALEIQERFQRLRTTWNTEGRPELEIGIGVSSGEVSLGVVGGAARRQFTAIGDAVNTAARLQALSTTLGSPVVISQSVMEMGDGKIGGEYLEDVQLKGKERRVLVYRLKQVTPPTSPR